ncbi:Trm112 family protein [Nakamurella lactea]|uniref:Trm112 family protein n=1 Tax=Nakamurella lactea TaxID=459515 RepID=UPI000414B0C6|nr:Trm112 family protein [Nakamurella lactea]
MVLQLDPVLLDVLACPDTHHAPLTVGTADDPDADALTCTECGRVFPVRDGIPVLLLDEATGGPAGDPADSADAAESTGTSDAADVADPAGTQPTP